MKVFRIASALALAFWAVACDGGQADRAEAIAVEYVASFYRGDGIFEKFVTNKTPEEIETERKRMSEEFQVVSADTVFPGDYEFKILFSNGNGALVQVVIAEDEVTLVSMGVFERKGANR